MLSVPLNIFYSILASDEIILPNQLGKSKLKGEIEVQQGSIGSIFVYVFFLMFVPLSVLIIGLSLNLSINLTILKILNINLTKEKIRKFYLKFIKFFGWIQFLVAIAGTLLAVKFPQTGTLVSLNGVIQEKILEKIGSRFEKKWSEEESDKFLENLKILEKNLKEKKISINKGNDNLAKFLKSIIELDNKKTLFLDILDGISTSEKKSFNRKELTKFLKKKLEKDQTKRQFIKDLRANWIVDMNVIVDDFCKRLEVHHKNLQEKWEFLTYLIVWKDQSSEDLDLSYLFQEEEQTTEIAVDIEMQPNSSTSVRRRVSTVSSNNPPVLNSAQVLSLV